MMAVFTIPMDPIGKNLRTRHDQTLTSPFLHFARTRASPRTDQVGFSAVNHRVCNNLRRLQPRRLRGRCAEGYPSQKSERRGSSVVFFAFFVFFWKLA